MNLQHKVLLSDSVFAQDIDGEMVLLDTRNDLYFGLDEVGGTIWRAIETHKGVLSEVLKELIDTYDADEETLQNDMFRFIGTLKEHGLAEVVS